MDPITNVEDVKYHLGRFYFQKKDYKKAIKLYKQGLRINPRSIILLYEIGLAYSELKNQRKALRYWKKLLRIAPHNSLMVNIKAKINK